MNVDVPTGHKISLRTPLMAEVVYSIPSVRLFVYLSREN